MVGVDGFSWDYKGLRMEKSKNAALGVAGVAVPGRQAKKLQPPGMTQSVSS